MTERGTTRQAAPPGRSGSLRALLGVTHAIRGRALICAIVQDRRLRFYPYAAGWRNDVAFVLGLVSGASGWRWEWIPAAELRSFFSRKGDWVAVPPTHRPPLDFLTHLLCEAE
jgi:hypothetical protein